MNVLLIAITVIYAIPFIIMVIIAIPAIIFKGYRDRIAPYVDDGNQYRVTHADTGLRLPDGASTEQPLCR